MTHSPGVAIAEHEVEITAIHAQGPGGQNVNKVATAIQLRFDIGASSLPEALKARLLAQADRRITQDGVFVLKVQTHRSQDRNRKDALRRLREWVASLAQPPKDRKPTQPTWGSRQRRRQAKTQRSATKAARARVAP